MLPVFLAPHRADSFGKVRPKGFSHSHPRVGCSVLAGEHRGTEHQQRAGTNGPVACLVPG